MSFELAGRESSAAVYQGTANANWTGSGNKDIAGVCVQQTRGVSRTMRSARKLSGFTLLELMVVVAIVAILLGLALPAYMDYIKRSKVRTAQADLRALSAVLEGHRQRTLAYPATAAGDTAAITLAFPAWSPASKSGDFGFAHATADGYTLTATGAGSISGCTLTLNAANQSGSTGGCWGAVQSDGSW
jgi:type IV pilus assembly protein PilE